jgi:hypothetical protein
MRNKIVAALFIASCAGSTLAAKPPAPAPAPAPTPIYSYIGPSTEVLPVPGSSLASLTLACRSRYGDEAKAATIHELVAEGVITGVPAGELFWFDPTVIYIESGRTCISNIAASGPAVDLDNLSFVTTDCVTELRVACSAPQ